MPNTIRTPKRGKSPASERIAKAVDNEEWQKFRLSMKGQTTAKKLLMLREYYEGLIGTDQTEDIKIRVDNYLKALCRGGQLMPGINLSIVLDRDWDIRSLILK